MRPPDEIVVRLRLSGEFVIVQLVLCLVYGALAGLAVVLLR